MFTWFKTVDYIIAPRASPVASLRDCVAWTVETFCKDGRTQAQAFDIFCRFYCISSISDIVNCILQLSSITLHVRFVIKSQYLWLVSSHFQNIKISNMSVTIVFSKHSIPLPAVCLGFDNEIIKCAYGTIYHQTFSDFRTWYMPRLMHILNWKVFARK